jgi:transposase
MQSIAERHEEPTAIQTNLGAIFVSLELSRSIWLVTSVSPGSGETMSKHSVPAGAIAALLARFAELKKRALARTGKTFPIIVIQEAGLDGFWIHRALESEGIESHVVDPASIATSRRRCHTTFNLGLIDSWCKTEMQAFGIHLITHRKSP